MSVESNDYFPQLAYARVLEVLEGPPALGTGKKIITLPIRLMFHHFIWDEDHNEKKISCHYIIP